MNIHPDVVKAYKKTLDADDKHAEYGTTITKRNATRAATQLSKKIKQHHGDLNMSDKIKLRTKLQDMGKRNEDVAPATSIGNASVSLPPTMRPMVAVDRRRKKDGPVVLLKRFRKHLEDG